MPRNYTIDYIRLIAAFGVIFIHLAPSTLIAEQITQYFLLTSVQFFLITSLYLFQSKGARFEKINFARILIPYISWSVIYLISRTIGHIVKGTSFNYDWLSVIFFGGAGIQLYFLPLLLYVSIAASAVNVLFGDRDYQLSTKLLALFSLGVLMLLSELLKGSNYLGFSDNFYNKILYYIVFSQAVVILLPNWIKIKDTVFLCSVISIVSIMFLGFDRVINR